MSLWGDRNQSALDYWTLAHFGTGVAAGVFGFPLWATLGAGTLYELVEPAFDYEVFGAGFKRSEYRAESIPNRFFDIVAVFGGWVLGATLREAKAAADLARK